MSLTTEQQTGPKIANPTRHYISFSGERGTFEYWDGSKSVALDEISFTVVDVKGSVGGWSDSDNSRIYSNYFENGKEQVVIKTGRKGQTPRTLFSGPYTENKETIVALGGKYQTNLFGLMLTETEHVPVIIQFSASALAAWSDYVKTLGYKGYYGKVITASKSEPKKKGRVVFHTPVFSSVVSTEETMNVSKEYDAEYLQPYLGQFKATEVAEVAEPN